MSGLVVGPSESERTGEQESMCEKDCANTIRDKGLRELRRTCGYVRVCEGEAGTSVFLMAVTRTFIIFSHLCFLIVFYQLKFFFKNNNVKCQVLWVCVFFRSLFLLSDLTWMLCLVECSIFSLLPPFLCENVTLCRRLYGGGGTRKVSWSLQVSSEVDVVNVWQVPIESLCLKWLRMHFLCFVTQREVWNKTEVD